VPIETLSKCHIFQPAHLKFLWSQQASSVHHEIVYIHCHDTAKRVESQLRGEEDGSCSQPWVKAKKRAAAIRIRGSDDALRISLSPFGHDIEKRVVGVEPADAEEGMFRAQC
jgi:hypothetical protein